MATPFRAARRGMTPLAFALLLPLSASAQSWSAEERAVIDQLQTCFNTWHEALAKKDFAVYDRACPHDDDLVAWWVEDGSPEVVKTRAFDNFPAFAELYGGRRARFIQVRPLAVRIHGEAAVVFYYLRFTWLDKQGDPQEGEVRRAEWFVRRQGRWTLAAIMASEFRKF